MVNSGPASFVLCSHVRRGDRTRTQRSENQVQVLRAVAVITRAAKGLPSPSSSPFLVGRDGHRDTSLSPRWDLTF